MSNYTRTVGPGKLSTSLADAIADCIALGANLTTDCCGTGSAGILTISIEGDWSGGADTSAVTVDGFTTSSDYYLKICTDAANRASAASWNTAKYILEITDDDLAISDNHVWIDGLQIRRIYSAVANGSVINVSTISAANEIKISNCRIYGDQNNTGNINGIRLNDADTIAKIWNCIIYNCDDRGIFADNQASVSIFNCTIYLNTVGVEFDVGTCVMKNCAVFNNTDDIKDDTAAATIDYCASDDNDGTNNVAESGGGADWPSDFTAAATGNFTLVTGSNLIGAGVVDPGSGLFSDDMEGTARGAAWDLGAFEYVAAATGTVIPQMMAYYRRLRS